MKGRIKMDCKHGRLKTIGKKGKTRLFCLDCGAELDISLLMGQKQAEKPAPDPAPGKSPEKKTRAKKAQKSEE